VARVVKERGPAVERQPSPPVTSTIQMPATSPVRAPEPIAPDRGSIECPNDRQPLPTPLPSPVKAGKLKTKIVGIGGTGVAAVDEIASNCRLCKGATFCQIDTDATSLRRSKIRDILHIETGKDDDGGTGGDVALGKLCMEANIEKFREMGRDCTDVTIIVTSLTGGTGCGSSPVVARAARDDLKCLTIGVVSLPFNPSGVGEMTRSTKALENLEKCTDYLLLTHNLKKAVKYITTEKLLKKVSIISKYSWRSDHILPQYSVC